MTELSREELIKVNVDILRDIHNFCMQNGIEYSLFYGTLIGAIRHQGFIPWDDDVDIVMPRAAYNKFVNLYKSERYKLYCCELDINYDLPIGRLADETTLKVEKTSTGKNTGIAVDIFPLDGKVLTRRNLFFELGLFWLRNAFRFKGTTLVKQDRKWYKNIIVGLIKVFLLPYSIQTICKTLNRYIQKFDFENSVYVGSYLSPYKKKDCVKRSAFDAYVDVKFEGHTFKAMSGYDEYLRSIYGDYMKLPPLNHRGTSHNAKFFRK